MSHGSYWDIPNRKSYPALEADQRVDVAIIGGGITGLSAAYLLQRSGRRVALVERDRLGFGDTGVTTAHLTAVTDLRPAKLLQNFGRENAQLVWRGGMAAIATIEAIAHGSGCEFERVLGYLHQSLTGDDHTKDDLKKDAEAAREIGAEAQLVASVPYFDLPGVVFPNQAKFHPLKYLQLLAESVAADHGSAIFENSEVTEVRENPLVVVANGHEIACDYVIVATHVPLMGITGLVQATALQTKLAPYTSYVVGATVPKNTLRKALYWDTSEPYYYTRVEQRQHDDYVIFGGSDHKTGQVSGTDQVFDELAARLTSLIPAAKVEHRWSGQVIETNDGLPYIGESADKQFVATGFSGNGMTFGTLAAMMACDRVLERENAWADLFAINRTHLRGGTWNYVRENLDYPYYLVADRFSAAQGASMADVAAGEGKLLDVDGQRVACYRDAEGEVTFVSAVCTHMGCFVRWNPAEQTWDCPCHGSRFRPSGEVLAGPAETPLPPIELPQHERTTS